MENAEQWETITNNLTYILHTKQDVFIGGIKVKGKGYPYCADPMGSLEGFHPQPLPKKVDYCVKSCTADLLTIQV